MTSTEQYVEVLTHLKPGELGLLRKHAGQGLDRSVEAFDLFAGLWWPLRAKNRRAPRRAVAWLVAKLYAFRPIEHSTGQMLAQQLGRCVKDKQSGEDPLAQRFDAMLTLPLAKLEPALRWALDVIASHDLKLDWVELTDDLSFWDLESKRLKWAEEFLKPSKENGHAD